MQMLNIMAQERDLVEITKYRDTEIKTDTRNKNYSLYKLSVFCSGR